MSELLNTLLLLAAPLLPFLLSLPALRSLLPNAQFVALLPAVLIVVMPATFSAELPWLLFGSEMTLDGYNRLLLALSVIVWAIALYRFSAEDTSDLPFMSFLLLVMAGNFGAIIAADLLLFFGFTTLMGYAFYALFMASDKTVRPVARVYLWLMIVADLLLFEVLLLLAVNNTNLGFASANATMAESPLLALSLWLVVSGFMLKAGIWPFHFWLSSAYRCAKPALRLLLAVVPVSVALLGLLRWLPLGEISLPMHGLIVQGLGVSAMLYVVVSVLKKADTNMGWPVQGIFFMTGLFFTGIGAGLINAAIWNRMEAWGYYYVAVPGVVVLLLVWLQGRKQLLPDDQLAQTLQTDDLTIRVGRFAELLVCRMSNTGFYALPGWRDGWLARVKRLGSGRYFWQRIVDFSETRLARWPLAITLFLLLGITVVFISSCCSS